jgi:hypothetical protein
MHLFKAHLNMATLKVYVSTASKLLIVLNYKYNIRVASCGIMCIQSFVKVFLVVKESKLKNIAT